MTAACSTNRPREDRSVSESGVGALSPPANVIGKNNHVVAETTVGGRSVRLKGRFLQRRVKGVAALPEGLLVCRSTKTRLRNSGFQQRRYCSAAPLWHS